MKRGSIEHFNREERTYEQEFSKEDFYKVEDYEKYLNLIEEIKKFEFEQKNFLVINI